MKKTNEIDTQYILDEETAVVAGIPYKERKSLIRRNKARINTHIVAQLVQQKSYQALRLLYGIANLDSIEKIYGVKEGVELNNENSTIKIEVTQNKVQDDLEKL